MSGGERLEGGWEEQHEHVTAGEPPPSPSPRSAARSRNRAGTHQDTEVRAVSGVKVSAGSVWMGRHCIQRVLSLVSFEKMLVGSVVKPLCCALQVPPPI